MMTPVALLAVLLQLQQPAAPPAPPQMVTYQMVFLHAPKGAPVPPAGEARRMQDEHLAHLIALNKAGTNLLFGPFLDDGSLRGIAILDVPDADAARRAFAADPFVKAGYMMVEVRPWMGPRGWFHPPAEPHTPEPLVFGFLIRGPNAQQPSAEAQALQKGHLAYMDQLHAQGKLVAAGPFLDNTATRGLVIYRVGTVEEAKRLAADDPMVKAGRLVIDARPWMTFKGILK